MKIFIVGAGIIGAALADALAGDADVTIIDAGTPGQGATAASFGWINASFYLTQAHFTLRNAGIEAYHALNLPGPDWSGALCWDVGGAEFDQTLSDLQALDYPVQVLNRSEVQKREPILQNIPDRVLHFPSEGAVNAQKFTATLLTRAFDKGAQMWSGCQVHRLLRDGSRVTGVETTFGRAEADLVIVAAGTATATLLPEVVRMKHRPGLILRTRPQPRLINRVMVSPEGEFRQLSGGEIIMPLAAGHQSTHAEPIAKRPELLANAAFDNLKRYLPQITGHWAQITAANRPVPQDDLPIIGPVCDGAYVSVMHSGVTLAAIAGQLVAQEVLGGQMDPMLAPFRVR